MKPVNYKNFKLRLLNTKEYKHVYLLLFWPVYLFGFIALERLVPLNFHTVYSPLDDLIPFCEVFIIPYFLWYAFIVWVLAYGLFFDTPTFKKNMYFFIVTFSLTLLTYLIYPTKQELRPQEFLRDNIFVDIVRGCYAVDTNTNVCPSLHCIGSFVTAFSAINSRRYSTVKWKIFFILSAFLISFSTVFVKQHSIIDVFWGIAISFIVYPFIFRKKKI